MKITVDMRDFDKTEYTFSSLQVFTVTNVARVIKDYALKMLQSAFKRCPVKTGLLRSMLGHLIHKTGLSAEIGVYGVEYAADVEFGTKAHEIKPRNKKALYWKGARHPVKSVQHPGTKPQPYLFPAFEEHREAFVRDMQEALKHAVKKVSK
jgi:hypothetical protein